MLINPSDNEEVNIKNGHKYAACDIKKGENIIKYGFPIGHATEAIKTGDKVHTHNLKTNLNGILNYEYKSVFDDIVKINTDKCFKGYIRENGDVGIRNEIWIVNTVGCINKSAKK
jgi:altronate hydrolase